MNIDDLKDAWNKDEPEGMHLPMSTAVLGKTTSAVAKIRKNMRMEFITFVVFYPVIFVILFLWQQNAFFFNTTCALLFAIVMLKGYYVLRFYSFYKLMGNYDLSIKNSVSKVAYQLEINIELYKAFNFCVTPLFLMIGYGVVCDKHTADYIQHALTGDAFMPLHKLVLLFGTTVLTFVFSYYWIDYYIRCLYGKYLTALKKIMDDLGADN